MSDIEELVQALVIRQTDFCYAHWMGNVRSEGIALDYQRKAEKEIIDAFAALRASHDLHADINRRTAEALGKPQSGDDSTWSDIPEQVVHLVARIDRLVGLLKQVEWGASDTSWGIEEKCPVCGRIRSQGHAPDCPLAAESGDK